MADHRTIDSSDISEKLIRLKELIGENNLSALLNEFGGSNLYIPKIDAFLKLVRDAEIKADYIKNGFTISKLRKKYGLSENQIRRILFNIKY